MLEVDCKIIRMRITKCCIPRLQIFRWYHLDLYTIRDCATFTTLFIFIVSDFDFIAVSLCSNWCIILSPCVFQILYMLYSNVYSIFVV